ncbi:clavesin-1 [Nilaparvata lugens]|uniref:clavesin-1 n=1 Tax=Nilaparvata lugens TaxID=108931 RepID=UPI00193D05D7|nr:clavesin-1 [Nilaparvata lugens]
MPITKDEDADVVMCRICTDPFDISLERKIQAETELGETKEKLEESLKLLKKRLTEIKDLEPETEDIFLTSFLRTKKLNVEKALKMVKEFYKIRQNYPKYFEPCLPSQKGFIYDLFFFTIPPERTDLGRAMLVTKCKNMDPRIVSSDMIIQAGMTSLKLCLEDPGIQVSGMIILLDLANFTVMQQLKLITPRAAYIIVSSIQDSFPVRVREIHVVNEPLFFDAIYAFFKPFLKEKFRKRIKIHGSDMSSLHKWVSPDVLPEEYGGNLPPLTNQPMMKQLYKSENKIKDWIHYGYIPKNVIPR